MSEYLKSESEGMFFLTVNPGRFDPRGSIDGDLGRGGSHEITAFRSAEAREYYIQADRMKRLLTRANSEIYRLNTEILGLVTKTGRVRRRAVLALVEQVKKEMARP